MKLPWKKTDAPTPDAAASGSTRASDVVELNSGDTKTGSNDSSANSKKEHRKGRTAPKGRPTPTRKEREIERGVIRDPNRKSRSQLSQRRKELKASMTKEEWKQFKKQEREEARERNRRARERMDSGDERYLMERDKGAERRFARDWIDSRRQFNNFFMPVALLMIGTVFISSFNPYLSNVLSTVTMVILILFFIEGFFIGKRVNKAVREKFPNTSETGFGLGFYAYSRSTQPRSWRTPKPQVALGENV